MAFQPSINQELQVNGTSYRIDSHPMAPHLPYGQEGRMATVYKLKANGQDYALKVFKQTYRNSGINSLSQKLRPFAAVPGLTVCNRLVLDPAQHKTLVQTTPDLAYAIIMPWIEGPTWMDILTEPQPLSTEQSLDLAAAFCKLLVELEEKSIAHCDLSGANLLFTDLGKTPRISLVDVEQLYTADMDKPSTLLVGTPGYGHRKVDHALWGPQADRFAGAILLAELLSWSNEQAREASWGESFFDPNELHEESERFTIMRETLEANWSADIASLFSKAWHSTALTECPSFNEWLSVLPTTEPLKAVTVTAKTAAIPAAPRPEELSEPTTPPPPASLEDLLAKARRHEEANELDEAIELYEEAQARLSEQEAPSTVTGKEIADIINALALKQIAQAAGVGHEITAVGQQANASEDGGEIAAIMPVIQPYTPAEALTKNLGGLTQTQFILALISLPVAGSILMYFAAQYLAGTWIWAIVSLPAMLGSIIYVALRRKWVAPILYSPIIFVSGLFVSASWMTPGSLAAIAIGGGLILEALTQIGAYFVPDHIKDWQKDFLFVTIASFVAATFIVEIVQVGIQFISSPEYWVVNLALAAGGWFVGDYLRQIIIQLREMRKGASNNG